MQKHAVSDVEQVAEVLSGALDREAVAITVYNDDLALIKERRSVNLPGGLSRLALREVSARLQPETALLQALDGTPLTLREQNFDFDLLTPVKLLEKFVGQEVTVITTNPATGAETREQARVLSANSGTVLRFEDRIESNFPGRIVFNNVPDNLRDRPTLSVLLETTGGSRPVELSYLSSGFSWRADYVANLHQNGTSMNLSAWVTLTNRSGSSFDKVSLQLVAGNLNRVEEIPRPEARPMGRPEPKGASTVQEETLMDYHLYSFSHPTAIADNQTKQIALLSATDIPVELEYFLPGKDHYYRGQYGELGRKLKPYVFMAFENKGGDLGKPLPAGVVRVYARDKSGAAQFVGEDDIKHTPKNERIRLKLGEAFDVTADRIQTDFKKLADNLVESSFRVEIRNAKESAVTVHLMEPLWGDWEIMQESHPGKREHSRLMIWSVAVPADGSAVLEYSVRAKW